MILAKSSHFLLLAAGYLITSVGSQCLHFEPIPCSYVRERKEVSGSCMLEDLASNGVPSNDGLSNDGLWNDSASNDVEYKADETGCCIDPVPFSCDCQYDGKFLPYDEKDCERDEIISKAAENIESSLSSSNFMLRERDVPSSSAHIALCSAIATLVLVAVSYALAVQFNV